MEKKLIDMNKAEFENYLVETFSDLPQTSGQSASYRDLSTDVYNFNNPYRGLAVIFNVEKFCTFESESKKPEDREGTVEDENNLIKSLSSLGFHVKVFRDIRAHQIKLAAKKAAEYYSHEKADCFVCVFLTHGSEMKTRVDMHGVSQIDHIIYGADQVLIKTHEIVNLFRDENCPMLKNKPRLFFIQACRGTKFDDGIAVGSSSDHKIPHLSNNDAIDADPCFKQEGIDGEYTNTQLFNVVWRMPVVEKKWKEIEIRSVPLYQDFLIMWGSPPGYYAWRNRYTGSWFIEELCMLLYKDAGRSQSFLRGLVNVCGKVSAKRSKADLKAGTHDKVTAPVVDSRLIKDIIFTSKKKYT